MTTPSRHVYDVAMSIFTEDQVEAFNFGDCWRLAAEMHRLTGWQMVAVGVDYEDGVDLNSRGWAHMAVRTPDGRFADVNGVHTEDEFLDTWREETSTRFFQDSDDETLQYMEVEDVEVVVFEFDVVGWAELTSEQTAYYPEIDAITTARDLIKSI